MVREPLQLRVRRHEPERPPRSGRAGHSGQALNIRFRDGSIYQSLCTDDRGFKAFNEVFPFFAWLVAEVDYTRFQSTGVTVVVDTGGVASASNPTGRPQAGLPAGLVPAERPEPAAAGRERRQRRSATNPARRRRSSCSRASRASSARAPSSCGARRPTRRRAASRRTSTSRRSTTSRRAGGDIDANNNGFFNTDRSNGGIAGIVHYTITRAENDPRWAAAENWEPGVSDVRVQLWDANRTHLLNEVTTDNWNNSLPEGCQGPPFTFLGRPTDCYDGLRNFNQARPALFDGGYAFSTILQDSPSGRRPYNLPIAEPRGARGRCPPASTWSR